ncbi:acyltransferase GLAUCE [Apium graveolens]|uniref:acyltransferase GLAUCE n=1 Tax=Apium graveolens TaxID=4045 RepID=UPI003D7A58BD
MGTLYDQKHLETPAILQDLKITYHDSSLIFPSQETEKRSMFLSNVDKILNFNVQTVHFFPHNSKFPPEVVTQKLKDAFSKVLVHYDFLAGRLKTNPESGRMEIDCNAAGAGFVVASTEYALDEIGDLVNPNPVFQGFAVQSMEGFKAEDQPLSIMQVTSFKCGGFVLGFSNNHCTSDGLSFKHFLENLASQAYDHHKPLPFIPCNDRNLLAARSPPRVTFTHPELLNIKLTGGEDTCPSVFDCSTPENLDTKVFRLSSADIAHLKLMAKMGPNNGASKITGFNVVTAHIWRCKALSCNETMQNPSRISTVLYAVDIRSRLKPPLPMSYSGNAVLSAYAKAPCTDLEIGPFSKIVDTVTEGSSRITEEYARSVIDYGETYIGFPNGEFLVSSWWRLGFQEVEYPWGKPKYSCPIVYHRKDIILLFPDINEGVNAVNVLVALPADEMEKFEALFYKFLK